MANGGDGGPSHPLAAAVFRTLSYADVFGYPMTLDEVCAYLVGARATRDEVVRALDDAWLADRIVRRDGYLALAGCEENFSRRSERADISGHLWQLARKAAPYLAALPFVRAVILTGSLAVWNARSRADDIDVLLITEPGRLWLARFGAVMLVHLARLRGALLCPNYLITHENLSLPHRSLFTAHELAQMVPLYGAAVYEKLLRANAWAQQYLPNAFGRQAAPPVALPRVAVWAKRGVEWALSGSLGDALEAVEMRRKVRKLSAMAEEQGALETCFDAHCCKGHFMEYEARTVDAYQRRLIALGLDVDPTLPATQR